MPLQRGRAEVPLYAPLVLRFDVVVPGEAKVIGHTAQCQRLAARILDPARSVAIVGVTVRDGPEQAAVDAAALAATLREEAEVWVIGASYAGALGRALPERLEVYGGAMRLWWPMRSDKWRQPRKHPIFVIRSPQDALEAAQTVIAAVAHAKAVDPAAGREVMGVVTMVSKAGAELTLVDGVLAFASIQHLVKPGPVNHAGEVLAVGQRVRVRMGERPPAPGRDRHLVSLRSSSLEPWGLLAERYRDGDLVEGIVDVVEEAWALVALLPGALGMLPARLTGSGSAVRTGDVVTRGQRIVVRLEQLDAAQQRATLSLRDLPDVAFPQRTPALFPDGPPWLRSEVEQREEALSCRVALLEQELTHRPPSP